MKKPNLPIIILCLAICVSGIAALSLKTFHTVNSTTSPYLLYLKVLQGNQQFYNVESGDYLDIHQLKETITSDNLPFSIQQFAIVDLTQNGIKDVVLQFSLAENNQAGFIILHDESGTIYSYTLVSRSMSDLKVDGTFIFSSGASDWGIGSLILSSSGYEIEKISYCESSLFFPCINVTVIEIASLRFPLLYFPTQYAVVPSIFRVGFPEIAFVLIAAEVGIMTVASNSTRKNSGIILFFIKTPPLCFE